MPAERFNDATMGLSELVQNTRVFVNDPEFVREGTVDGGIPPLEETTNLLRDQIGTVMDMVEKLRDDMKEMNERLLELYFSPGMPGAVAAQKSFKKVAYDDDDDLDYGMAFIPPQPSPQP